MELDKMSIPLIRAEMSLAQFKKWVESHKWHGDVESVWKDLRKKAGLPVSEKKSKTE